MHYFLIPAVDAWIGLCHRGLASSSKFFLRFVYNYRYQLMFNCWEENPDSRPTFTDLVRQFDNMISLLSDKVKALVYDKVHYLTVHVIPLKR